MDKILHNPKDPKLYMGIIIPYIYSNKGNAGFCPSTIRMNDIIYIINNNYNKYNINIYIGGTILNNHVQI